MTQVSSSVTYGSSRATLTLLIVAALLGPVLQGCSSGLPLLSPRTPLFKPEPFPVFRHSGFRIATLNAEFLFDGIDDEGEAIFPWKADPQLARTHRDRIGETLRRLDADIVVIVEVENLNTLELLLNESLRGMEYRPYLVDGTDFFTGQDVGILSRIPIEEVTRTDVLARSDAGADLQGVSKNIIARFTLAGEEVSLIGLHLLSRPSDPERLQKRQGQAEVIRMAVADEVSAGREVIVAGDFNDFDDLIRDRNGNRPITDVLKRIKKAGPGDADDLVNVMADVPQAARFTSHWDRDRDERVEVDELSAIDHILLSKDLYRKVREVRFVHPYDPMTVTDHFPIVISLDLDNQSN